MNHQQLLQHYLRVRDFSRTICSGLEAEDCVVQSMPDASPLRWHLAHTSWFFETFVLKEHCPSYRSQDDQYAYLFNSYYNALGDQFPRASRGKLSRPTMREVWLYRQAIDTKIVQALTDDEWTEPDLAYDLVELGLQHEQQHQELMLTDIKHAFSLNPLLPRYTTAHVEDRFEYTDSANTAVKPLAFIEFEETVTEIGHGCQNGFSYDNEQPRHRVLTGRFALANLAVTNGEYRQFIDDGGYTRPKLWLSEGWNLAVQHGWRAPLYWLWEGDQWHEFTLAGLQPLDSDRPVCHISYFEADAYARWLGGRLPTEFEWERVAQAQLPEQRVIAADGGRDAARFADQLVQQELTIHPQAVRKNTPDFADMLGNVWEWTSSAYAPYPGFRTSAGAIGEYNGKFMCNQYVLRGGSCATSSDHIRISYRNFFPAHARWQFSGLRCLQEESRC